MKKEKSRNGRPTALVLLSGGLDSAVALWWAKRRGFRLATLGFLFPGRRKMELAAARALSRRAGSRNFEVFLPFVPPPRVEEACYIPQRNLMYYGVAASLAETIGAKLILGGHLRHDGTVFKDARESYLKKLEDLAGPRIRFKFPLIRMGKREVVRLGARLGVPFEKAWSCSRDLRRPCGLCNSCRERREGFQSAGLADPGWTP